MLLSDSFLFCTENTNTNNYNDVIENIEKQYKNHNNEDKIKARMAYLE